MKPRTYRWDKGWRVRILGLLVLLLSLLVGLGSVLDLTYTRLTEMEGRAETSRQNVLLMEKATSCVAEMSSSLRGYLLTGEDAFLQPYASTKGQLDAILVQLETAATGNSAQFARVHQVEEVFRLWEKQVAEPEIAAKQANRSDVGRMVAGRNGQAYLDEIRNTGTQYIEAESSQLDRELASLASVAAQIRQITWIGVGLAAILTAAGFIVFARSVTKSVGALAAGAEAIARGERGVVVKTPLEGELTEVADAFSMMSQTLATQEEELQVQREQLLAQNEELLAQQEELQARASTLERQDRHLSRLNRMSQAMIGSIEIDQLGTLILDEYLDLFHGSAGALLLADPDSDKLTVQCERWLRADWHGRSLTPEGPLARCVARNELVVVRYPETISQVRIWNVYSPVVQEVYVPLVHATRVIAVVAIASLEPRDPSGEARALWNGIARQAAVALAAAMNHRELKRSMLAIQEQAAQVEELNARLEDERDRAAAQLDIYLSIVSTMRAGAWLTDTGGNLLVSNETFGEMFGQVPDGATLEEVLALMAEKLPEQTTFPDEIRELVQSRDGDGEGRIQLQNGCTLQWSSAPVGQDPDMVGRLFIFQDITELAKLDQLKSEFVNTVSHELRTPLTSIMGYLSLVLAEQVGKLQPQQKEFLEVVSRNTERLGNLINDVLDIQRIESGRMPVKFRPIHAAELIQHVAETFRVQAQQKGLAFKVKLPAEGLPLVTSDPDRLTQIIANLVSNAIKYTREGSVAISAEMQDEHLSFAVADTGIGISPAEQKRVFEKFYRSEDRYAHEVGGTGLGLSIVKMLTQELGGEIRLESELGKGSRFTIILPLQPQVAAG